jgi:GR25 family glycosyltransferase involved in LPS biosynthesis
MEACIEPATIVVINLDHATAAREAFLLRNNHLGPVRRFPGIDGTDIDRAALVSRGDIAGEIDYTDGMLGCTLSHFALRREVADGSRALTACEDDAVLAPGFIATANARLADPPDDWDIVLWGWNFDSWLIFQVLPGLPECLLFGDPTVTADNLTAASPEASRLFPLDRARGTLCYTVSPKGAAGLLALCRPVRPTPIYMAEAAVNLPNSGIDLMMSMFYPRLRAYVSVPPLAISPNLTASSTTRAAKPDNVMSPAGCFAELHSFPSHHSSPLSIGTNLASTH